MKRLSKTQFDDELLNSFSKKETRSCCTAENQR